MKIKNIAYYLPERLVTNQDLQKENPTWDMSLLEQRTGVLQRYIAAEDQTALDLALKACHNMFPQGVSTEIDGIIFCTQSPDHILPPNACILHQKLKLPEGVLAFDFNLACSGYIYGLALAEGLLVSGRLKNILLVTADTYSKYIHSKDRSVRPLFGDAAAVSWLTASDGTGTVVDLLCATSGEHYDKFIIPSGGCRLSKSDETAQVVEDSNGNQRSKDHIHMKGMDILIFVNSKIPMQINALLKRNNLEIKDIDCFIFHQASRIGLDSLKRSLNIDINKCFENIQNVGNTVSASIPIALKEAIESKRILPGHKVVLCGFGVGLSWATALVQF